MARRDAPPPDNIAQLWPFLAWLDDVWRRPMFNQELIEGPVFRALAPADQLLTHWLCYICDRVERATLWSKAGPVFSELVRAYSAGTPTIGLLAEIAVKRAEAKAFSYRSRIQFEEAQPIEFTARLPATVPITRTLLVLEQYERNLLVYLRQYWAFCRRGDAPEVMHRIAFLFDTLTYWELGRASDAGNWEETAQRQANHVAGALRDSTQLEARFGQWQRHCFDDKRLWAALRDWIAPGGAFRAVFLAGLDSARAPDIGEFVETSAVGLAKGLEVPGDVWNSRFLKRIFAGVRTAGPRQIREWYETLRTRGELPDDCWPSQFDVSFVYSPKMCDGRRQGSCLFRAAESRAWDLCPVRDQRFGHAWAGNPCPLVDHLCDFEFACNPESCPVPNAEPSNICPGCERQIAARTDHQRAAT